MSFTNLTGLKLQIVPSAHAFDTAYNWQLNFEIVGGSDTYNYFTFAISHNIAYRNTHDNVTLDVYLQDVWVDPSYQYIIITGGNDVQNQYALDWFNANAVEVPPVYYSITYNLTGLHIVSSISTIADTAYDLTVAQIAANQYYALPDAITVTGCDTYQYVKASGVIILSHPHDNVVITATGVFYRTYTITGLLTNLTYTGDATIGTGETAYGKLNASGIYYLPETIDVTGCDYVYDEITGDLTFSNPVDDVVIQATANEIDTSRLAIILYQNSTETNRVDKSSYLYRIGVIYGTLLSETSIIEPSITIYSQGVPIFTYTYIPAFGRYYYVRNVTSVSKDCWRIDLTVDVLMSFKTEILALTGIVARQENSYNNLIIDEMRPYTSKQNISIINADAGGNDFSLLQYDADNKQIGRYVLTAYCKYAQDYPSHTDRFRRSYVTNAKTILDWHNVCLMLDNFNSTNIKHIMDNLFANKPMEGIMSLRVYPFDLYNKFKPFPATTDWLIIGLGNTPYEDQNVECHWMSQECDKDTFFSGGNISLTPNDWTDYVSSYDLFIPFYGFIRLPQSEILNKKLTLRYYIDFDTGRAQIAVYASSINAIAPAENEIIKLVECPLGVDIPLSATNTEEMTRNMILTAASTALTIAIGIATEGAAAPIVAGVGATALSAARSMIPQLSHAGIGAGPYTATSLSMSPFIIKTTPDYVTPTNYAHLHGLPSMQSATLSSLTGFTVFDSINIENIGKITDGERGELETLLHTGIIL